MSDIKYDKNHTFVIGPLRRERVIMHPSDLGFRNESFFDNRIPTSILRDFSDLKKKVMYRNA